MLRTLAHCHLWCSASNALYIVVDMGYSKSLLSCFILASVYNCDNMKLAEVWTPDPLTRVTRIYLRPLFYQYISSLILMVKEGQTNFHADYSLHTLVHLSYLTNSA